MKKILLPSLILFWAMTGIAIAQTPENLTTAYQQFNAPFTGEWQQYGELFTSLQKNLFPRLFLLVITTVPVFFFLHYIAIGPMSFPHDGKQVYCYNLFVRIIHWVAAVSFSLLVLTGLLIIFAKLIGPGNFGIAARIIHLVSAVIFAISTIPMFLFWIREMLPALYDLQWMMIMGGYLSKKKKPVSAGKFNAGQKMWFWLATVGGGVMAVTGYFLYSHQGDIEILRLSAIIHNFLGSAMVALFITHLYMSLVSIKGSFQSMIHGYKAEAELKILHPKFKY